MTDQERWKEAAEHARHVYDQRKKQMPGILDTEPEIRLTAYCLSISLLTVDEFERLVQRALAKG